MSLGRRRHEEQEDFWIPTQSLPERPRHVFYEKLNGLLAEAGFDRWVEERCRAYYAEKRGRPSIPPGVYFRMLLVGYFEGIDSQRGIAWRCADSLSLARFLGYRLSRPTPDHSSLTYIRQRLPLAVHEEVFAFVLALAQGKGLLQGQTVAVDATTLEANAAMKSIVRKETGEDWKAYVARLAGDEGVEIKDDQELRRYDRTRKDKKVSNQDWESPSDPDSRIMKMKDGRTRLGYKAEHVVDLDSGLVLAARVRHGTDPDGDTLLPSVVEAQANLIRSGSPAAVRDVVADKGYHKNETLTECQGWGLRSYIPEAQRGRRHWTDKPPEYERAFRANRRRVRGRRSKRLQKKRSELVERSFAQVCDTGGARRSWLRGLDRINKRYLLQVAAHNLGRLLRHLFGVGKPRCLQGRAGLVHLSDLLVQWLGGALRRRHLALIVRITLTRRAPFAVVAA